jgi:hypothetical protein
MIQSQFRDVKTGESSDGIIGPYLPPEDRLAIIEYLKVLKDITYSPEKPVKPNQHSSDAEYATAEKNISDRMTTTIIASKKICGAGRFWKVWSLIPELRYLNQRKIIRMTQPAIEALAKPPKSGFCRQAPIAVSSSTAQS